MPNSLPEDKATLLQRRDELRARLVAIQRDYQQGLAPDSEERAAQLENAEVLAEISRVTAEELARVEQRLEGLDD